MTALSHDTIAPAVWNNKKRTLRCVLLLPRRSRKGERTVGWREDEEGVGRREREERERERWRQRETDRQR